MREFFEELWRRADVRGASPALVSGTGTRNYRDLVGRIREGAAWAASLPDRIGLLFGRTSEYVLADLALSFAGKELVPLPAFFSDAQLDHIVRAAGLSHVVVDQVMQERARRLGLNASELGALPASTAAPAAQARRIIFTSGSTGKPRGVRLGTRQVQASTRALAEATGATAEDRYLSVLPSALLLEQIAGIYVPLSVGAAVYAADISMSAAAASSIAAVAERARPTVTVLVPDLLSAWVRELEVRDQPAPPSLRYVAVGGAAVPDDLASAAWRRGLTVHEGYGLSECCSVVAVNKPGQRKAGTVGRPIRDVGVEIENDEIIVRGPTVMTGYVNEPDVSGGWATGDLGGFDAEGYLVVKGRKDNLIVTGAGRNVSPEWIETMIRADRRIKRCTLVENRGELVAVITPADAPVAPDGAEMRDVLVAATRHAPQYARPARWMVMSDVELMQQDLLTANGRPRRPAIRAAVAERARMSAHRSISE